MRKLVGITALFAGLAILFSAGAMPAYADPGNNGNPGNNKPGQNNTNNPGKEGSTGNPGTSNSASNSAGNGNAGGGAGGSTQTGNPPGANGTVKIHDWPEHKNGAEMANDPKVCQFEVHGFKFDPGQKGRWWVQGHQWGNGDESKAVLPPGIQTYAANPNGDWTSGPHKLADGHYKLFVEMTHSAGNSGNTVVTYKMKVFKVECPTSGAPNGTGNTETGNTETGNTETGNTGTVITVDTQTTGDVTVRTETTTVVRGGQQIQTFRVFNNDTLVSTTVIRSAVAGFESVPTGVAIIGTGPEVPAGMGLDDSQGLTGVNGAESAPMGVAGSESTPEAALAGIASLPATSTGAAGLGLAGLAITGLGLALLRRQPK